jgi:2-oxoglutarate dehydrogenase E1 component
MSQGTAATRWNLDAVEAMYQRWRQDPNSVDSSWQYFFQGFELGLAVLPSPPVLRGRGEEDARTRWQQRRSAADRHRSPHVRLP